MITQIRYHVFFSMFSCNSFPISDSQRCLEQLLPCTVHSYSTYAMRGHTLLLTSLDLTADSDNWHARAMLFQVKTFSSSS